MFRHFLSYVTSAALVIGTMPAPLGAQPAPVPAPAPVAAADQGQAEDFSSAQLDALLAPIALYPDALLTQLLMATTNPLEIVAASRWLAQGANKSLKGRALENALKTQPWDPSVKSLVPFPQVLEMLNQQLEWTEQLGYAMQAQRQTRSTRFSACAHRPRPPATCSRRRSRSCGPSRPRPAPSIRVSRKS